MEITPPPPAPVFNPLLCLFYLCALYRYARPPPWNKHAGKKCAKVPKPVFARHRSPVLKSERVLRPVLGSSRESPWVRVSYPFRKGTTAVSEQSLGQASRRTPQDRVSTGAATVCPIKWWSKPASLRHFHVADLEAGGSSGIQKWAVSGQSVCLWRG